MLTTNHQLRKNNKLKETSIHMQAIWNHHEKSFLNLDCSLCDIIFQCDLLNKDNSFD